jgi:hypothetical protein
MMAGKNHQGDFRMDKRQFLGSAALAAAALPARANVPPGLRDTSSHGPALLTITGAINRTNRGPLDPALDQMMHKQGISFAKALALDFDALLKLPLMEIAPRLEYDGKPHKLHGPRLLDVIGLAGVKPVDSTQLVLRAVDGYNTTVSAKQANEWQFMVATHIDGRPIPLGGLGPLWAVYDPDWVPEMVGKPLAQRFGSCPWALYHIEVPG